MKSKIVFLTMLLGFIILTKTEIQAQNTVITDDPAYTGQSSAQLDVKSLNKGFLVPRLTTAQMNGITTPVAGLLVFNITLNGFCYYSGTEWITLSSQLLTVNAGLDEPLFKILNAAGDTVFAVFPEGVRIKVGNGIAKGSGNKGGFAVGGFGTGKIVSQEYLRITNDSVRIYVNPNPPKGSGNKGGFAVGGFGTGKAVSETFLRLKPLNYFIGHQSGDSMTNGSYNSFFGYQSGISNTSGSYNIFSGYQSGYRNKSGDNNVFLGNLCGYKNTIGYSNVFIGNETGYSNTEGSHNVFVGLWSGKANLKGNYNVMMGFNTGMANTNGSKNTFLGFYSGIKNTLGEENVFIGGSAGIKNTTESGNTYIGYAAGQNTAGIGNVLIGYGSGCGPVAGNTGSSNTFIGSSTGNNLTTGSKNVLVGYSSGTSLTGGVKNTFIGYYSGASNLTGGSNVFIGYQAGFYETNSDRLYIENTLANSTEALIYGEFDNNLVRINGTLNVNNIIHLTPRASAPLTPQEGDMYYNSTDHKLKVYDGTTWQNCW